MKSNRLSAAFGIGGAVLIMGCGGPGAQQTVAEKLLEVSEGGDPIQLRIETRTEIIDGLPRPDFPRLEGNWLRSTSAEGGFGQLASRIFEALVRTALVVISFASAEVLQAQQLEERSLAERFRIGGVDAPEFAAFSAVPDLIVDSSETLYALDRNQARVSIFDPAGRHVRSVGRQGKGPGEFEIPVAHGLVGDTLWVLNWPTPRISFFSRAGDHIKTERIEATAVVAGVPQGISTLLADGKALRVQDAVPPGTQERLRAPILLTDRRSSRADTLGWIPLPRGMFMPSVGSWTYAPFPLPALYAAAPDGGAIAVANWDRMRPEFLEVRVTSAGGELTLAESVRLPLREVSEDVVADVIQEGVGKARGPVRAAEAAGEVNIRDLERAVREALAVPDVYPPVQDIVLGSDGTIWLRQMTGIDEGPWLVLSDKGDPLFRIRVPERFQIEQASRSTVWGTWVDDLDVPYVIRMDVVSSS